MTEIETILGFSQGEFPFRYLGVPLAASRLKGTDYAPLIDRIADLINTWTSMTLSFAGRLELLKTVIQGVCCYWLGLFAIPLSVIEKIEKLCRIFLWGSTVGRVAWRQVCLPTEEGGLGLRDLRTWNKVLLVKTMWNFHLKKDTLWVKWANKFFLRGVSIWEWVPKQDSPPFFKNLCRIRNEMSAKSGSIKQTIETLGCWENGDKLHVHRIYEWLRPRADPKLCYRTLWNSMCAPKHSYMVWLALLGRLPTRTRLGFLGGDRACVFCMEHDETHDHLFFSCRIIQEVWTGIRNWLRISRNIATVRSGLKWLKKEVKGNSWLNRARRIAFFCLIYTIWNRIYKVGLIISPSMMIRKIQIYVYQSLSCRFPEFARKLEMDAVQPGNLNENRVRSDEVG